MKHIKPISKASTSLSVSQILTLVVTVLAAIVPVVQLLEPGKTKSASAR